MAISVSLSKKELDARQYKIVCELFEVQDAIFAASDPDVEQAYIERREDLKQEHIENEGRILALAREEA